MLENPRRERLFAWVALLSPLWPVTLPLLIVWGVLWAMPHIIRGAKDMVSHVVSVALGKD